jgi:integrase/recombinase XerD
LELSEAIEGYLLFKAGRVSARTIEVDTGYLGQFISWRGNVDAEAVTSEDVRDYLASLTARGLTAHTVKRHHTILSAFYTWLCSPDIGLATDNPVRKVPSPKLPKLMPKALSQEQIEALLTATAHSKCRRRDRALVCFMLDSGARGPRQAARQRRQGALQLSRAKSSERPVAVRQRGAT